MKLSIDTEDEEIEELRHTIAIIEDAIKRRENPESYEEDPEIPMEEPPSQPAQTQVPEPSPQPGQTQTPEVPEVDMSSLAMSDYGQEKENRTMDNVSGPGQSQPQEPQRNTKEEIKEIIMSIKTQNPGQPIQMTDIIAKAQEKNIQEDETRTLVNELQKEGTI